MSEVRIRVASAGDAEAMARLIDELGYPVTAEDVGSRLAEIEAAGHCALLAESDGRVVGCLTTSMTLVLHRPAPVGRISLMVVGEAFRSQGIGAQMVAAAEHQVDTTPQCFVDGERIGGSEELERWLEAQAA